jgi:hypothetical protein
MLRIKLALAYWIVKICPIIFIVAGAKAQGWSIALESEDEEFIDGMFIGNRDFVEKYVK